LAHLDLLTGLGVISTSTPPAARPHARPPRADRERLLPRAVKSGGRRERPPKGSDARAPISSDLRAGRGSTVVSSLEHGLRRGDGSCRCGDADDGHRAACPWAAGPEGWALFGA